MNLNFEVGKADKYKSNSQVAKILTESWVGSNGYCPNCGQPDLNKYINNKPVADFYCKSCGEDFELKSKGGVLGRKVVDGAYSTMISRITSDTNPNFFFLTYNKEYKRVNDFLIIPKHFFTLEIIEKRKPLAITARRAGWTGCNINLSGIPALGRIFLIKGAKAQHKKDVLLKWQNSLFLRNENAESKGWTLDVLKCIDAIQAREFSLPDIYKFEDELRRKHPLNNFIQPKIRQQLQILRDKGVLKFVSKGKYLKIE